MKTLKEFAKANRIPDRTASDAYKAGRIKGAYKNQFGKILVAEAADEQ